MRNLDSHNSMVHARTGPSDDDDFASDDGADDAFELRMEVKFREK